MPLHSTCSEPEPPRPRKRARECDGSVVEYAPASKRHKLLTPSPSHHCLDKSLTLPSLVLTQSQPAGCLERLLEENNSNSVPASKRLIHDWLQTVHLHHTASYPPQPTGERVLMTVTSDNHQSPLYELSQNILQSPSLDMVQSEEQSFGGSISSTKSKIPTSSAAYRSILQINGVRIDHKGRKIPNELRKFIDTDILKKRPFELSTEDVVDTEDTAIRIADKTEANVYDLLDTAMFPVKRRDIDRGGNTPWSTKALPRITRISYPHPLAAPKPDVYIGYPAGLDSTWTVDETAVVNHWAAMPYTRPALGSCFPFLMFELKSEATGGTLWQAENQAAGSGAHCVNSMRWFFGQAYPSKTPSILDTVAFTIVATHRDAIYHVHFYSEEDKIFYMSFIGSCSTLRDGDIQRSNDITKNILEHGLGTRQEKIRSALGDMGPCLRRWKPSRSASVLDPPIDGQSSSKSLRQA